MVANIRTALIVGAGIAGLACARALLDGGVAVTVLDKGRRPGGRVATRRTEGLTFNHGAQFASAHGPAFRALLTRLNAVAWPEAGPGRFVFLPGMSALPAAMAAETAVLAERHGAFLHATGNGWAVRHFPASAMRPGQTGDTGGELAGPYDAVLVAAPAPQAAALLRTAAHPFAAVAARAVMAPCWAVMARFPSPIGGPAVLRAESGPAVLRAESGPGAPRPESGAIAWAARESARPGSPDGPEAWTLHASADWSRNHLEDPADAVCPALLAAFRAVTGAPEADWARTHRWRHALVETAIGEPSLWDADERIGACGDWCLGGRIEAAFDSGTSLAAQVLAAR